LNTHHHWDHAGGNLDLKKAYSGVQIYGPKNEASKIPGIDYAVGQDDTVTFGDTTAKVLDVGGHTKGHIAYHFEKEGVAFVGDALFAIGCGRMFEGTPQQFWKSLKNMRMSFPDATLIYCAHEYTESNGRFALSVEPKNEKLVERMKSVKQLRSKGLFTVPSTMGEEKLTNPFLRVDVSDEIRENVGAVKGEDDSLVFAKVRLAKDNFRG